MANSIDLSVLAPGR